jgi:hypothetical protein
MARQQKIARDGRPLSAGLLLGLPLQPLDRNWWRPGGPTISEYMILSRVSSCQACGTYGANLRPDLAPAHSAQQIFPHDCVCL